MTCKTCKNYKEIKQSFLHAYDTEFAKRDWEIIDYCTYYNKPCYDAILNCTILEEN